MSLTTGKPVYRPGVFGPHTEKALFEICAGAILAQNTAWTNAQAAIVSLDKAASLTPEAVSRMDLETLGGLIRSSGFFRQKAGRLKLFSTYLLERHPEGLAGWFSRSGTADLRAELLALKGIGPETADSMLLYAGCKPKFVVDAYTCRIFGRLAVAGGAYAGMQAAFETALPKEFKVYNEYHALIVALGKNYCRKTGPLCEKCPLKKMCGKKYDNRKT